MVYQMAHLLKADPDMTVEEAAAAARTISEQAHMCFLPDNLDYLRAGGRVSNTVALVGNVLSLHPCIEVVDGKLLARKKYRGKLIRIIPSLISDQAEKYRLKKDHLYFIWSAGLSDDVKAAAETSAKECGFEPTTWIKTGCVITCHGGPRAFGIVGFSESD